MTAGDPSLFVGVDVGASKIASGLVELPGGRVVASASEPTPPIDSVRDHVDLVVRSSTRMFERAGARSVAGLGVGVCELVDREGRVRSAASVELRGDRLISELSPLSGSVVIDSDVRAHALAEASVGLGRAFEDFAFVSAGTGISSCLVIGGSPYAGARGNAIVLGSSPVTVRCTSCGAETSEILEEVASGRAIAAAWGLDRAEDAFDAAAAGDDRAIAILARAATALGGAIAFLANVSDPGAIVIGGGLASAPEPFWSDVERETRMRIWSEETRALPFSLSTLGPDAGVVGAACLPWVGRVAAS
jgi:glucokinase